MTGPGAEMPFLDHLEELRARLIRSLLAIVAGCVVGFMVVQRFELVGLISRPIQPYLGTGGKLTVLTPTEPVMIVFKLSMVVGLVIATPVVLWQTWAFLAPALYGREKKVIVPALFVGSLLFLLGAVLGWLYVVPQTLRVLFSFQNESLQPMITYDGYFSFLLRVLLALGISFELPLLIIILALLGVATPARLNYFRRYAIVLACIAGAFLSPGADVLTMIMFTIPLLILYEIGYAGSAVVARLRARKAAAAAVVLFLAFAGGGRLEAQDVVKPARPVPADSQARPDSLRPGGMPGANVAGQSRDSVLEALLRRSGYVSTRFRSDSATLWAADKRMQLEGNAFAEREGMTLRAGRIGYDESECLLTASGDPVLTEGGKTLEGEGIRYDTCRRRGMVRGGETSFNEGGTVWFLRGNVSKDSSSTRIFAGASEITSCDLPTAHYHFAAGKIKWVSQSVIVARPVVLYIRDIPVLWLPFIFQDTRPNRHSGILVPKVGINDLVRTSDTYNRQITNLGYYWAPSEYVDFTARLDWYSGRYLQFGVESQYKLLDRFLEGSLGVNRQFESGGGSGFGLRWSHRQAFNISTNLNFDINYLSNSTIVEQNALDPLLNTQQITSSVNFTRRFGWGSLALGGNRRQNLSDSTSTTQLPSLTISPKPLDIGRSITWSPGLSLVRTEDRNRPLAPLLTLRPDGGVDTLAQVQNSRVTSLNFDTPIRVGAFNWRNALTMQDSRTTGREVDSLLQPDFSTPDPNDSVLVYSATPGSFQTGLNWETGINLPLLARSTWKLQPTIGVTNASTQSPFFGVRNRTTGGAWVFQNKRLLFSASLSPTFFGLTSGGIGPVTRFRHSFSPLVRWEYAPSASVNEAFARAVTRPGQQPILQSDARHTLSLALTQNLEGKGRPEPGDTAGISARKFRLLSLSTTPLVYDFEQAKEPGATGWVTQSITNTALSDLLPGFNLSFTHDLWRGRAGVDTSEFSPFLQNVSASFSLSGRTVRSIGGFFGLGRPREPSEMDDAGTPFTGGSSDDQYGSPYRSPFGGPRGMNRPNSPGSFYSNDQIPMTGAGRGFTANVTYSLSRRRPNPALPPESQQSQQNLNVATIFAPTPLWAVSWQTQYNVTEKRFESHVVRLERDLHDWRAAFNFVRNANGNVAVYFSVYLTDLPELKLDFNQSTLGN